MSGVNVARLFPLHQHLAAAQRAGPFVWSCATHHTSCMLLGLGAPTSCEFSDSA